MAHHPRKRLCLLGAAAITVSLASACGPGGKLTNCASLEDRRSPTKSYEHGSRMRLTDLQVDPTGKWGPSNCQ